MTKDYRPSKLFIRSLWTMVLALLVAFLVVGITSGTATVHSVVRGMSLLTVFFLLFPILLGYFSHIEINGESVKCVKLLVFRQDIPISTIQAVRLHKTFVGLFTDIVVEFVDRKSRASQVTIGTVEVYGEDTFVDIVTGLLERNSSIKLDAYAESILERAGRRRSK
jgi:hypothetical protein